MHEAASLDDAAPPGTVTAAALVQKLLRSGAAVTVQNSKGHTPLHVAADSGRLSAAEALLEGGELSLCSATYHC